ncbi:MAG: TonB-dependent receptor domain-containing protein [Phenylobacterium sp.]|uniref:TonB-dependent receptor n=1 Tax=Phenylobacterium sp. TaxID=1871053 RepID=UPI0039199599
MKRLAGGVALTALACAVSTAVYAQETTGSVRGQVTDDAGAPVASATVTITHVPTGSTSTSVTGPDGNFSARGLRVGGPYRVSASAADHESGQVTIQAIGVGDAANVNVVLAGAGGAVSELVVTAAKAAPSQGGPSTNFSVAQIQALPSISRDLKDIARIDPFATIDPTNQDALSFAGANTRFNQLTVDGIRQNDDFGLNNNGYPTQRSPISIDAVEALNVSSAPYSVINNGFLGGQINAVTKSGTNEFHGTVFYEKTGDDLQGHTLDGVKYTNEFSEKVWGATLGGPIIKDNLFFFVAYEKYEGELGFDTGPVGSGAGTVIPRITTQAIDTFVDAVNSIYGYDPGSYLSGAFPVEDEKWLAKIDWNISDKHRLSIGYQNTLGNSLNGSTSSTFANGNSTTQPRVGLASNQYNKIEELTAYSAQLNSNWTDAFSTELRYSSKEQDTQQNPLSGLSVGQVIVNVSDLTGVEAGAGTPQIQFGADTFRHDNYLNTKVETYEAIARYHWGEHDILAGFRTEKDDVFNVFVSNSLGSYNFASYADFLARRASSFSLSGGVDPTAGTVPATLGTARLGAATFSYRLSSLYAEDRLQILPNLDVSAGFRFDWYSMDDKPLYNASFFERNKFSNQQNLDGKHVLLPRVSFNWEPVDRLRVSGGIGKFSSQGLNVWVSNAYSNTGVSQTNAVCPAGPYTNVDLTRAPAGCTFTPGNGDTNVIDPALKIPTVWKGNISVGYTFDLGRFGDDWLVQVDYLKSVNQNALYWYNLRSVQVGTAPDGRPVYAQSTVTSTGNNYDFMLANTDEGESRSHSITVAKNWREGLWDGLGMRLIYTNTRATDANPMTSSIAQSSYTRYGVSDPQNPQAATSDYEIRNRFSADFSYARKFFGDNETLVHVFMQNRSGLPFSYTFANSRSGSFDNDFGYNVSSYSGRQASSNALIYVPTMDNGAITATSDANVRYVGGSAFVAQFNEFVQNSGLAKYAGSIAPRNAFKTPDVFTIDVHLSQELPAFFPNGAKLIGYMDIENLGNLLNDEWGVLEQYDFHRSVPVVNVRCITSGGSATSCATPGAIYEYSGTGVGGSLNVQKPYVRTESSFWQVKLGIKYKF